MTSSSPYFMPESLKVAVIREEFVGLTKDPMVAIVLNQMIYWTQRVKDFDLFLAEEKMANPECNVNPRHGWIYKTADDLIDETMLAVSRSTMLRYLNTLVEGGWIEKRSHPTNGWDKTTQYRIHVKKIHDDLRTLGYTAPGIFSYSGASKTAETSKFYGETSKFDDETSKFQNATSRFQNETCISEITPETINRDSFSSSDRICAKTHARDNEEEEEDKKLGTSLKVSADISLAETMFLIWKQQVGQEELVFTDERRQKLAFLLNHHMNNNVSAWEALCKNVKETRFLMGGSQSGWKITLDWIVIPENCRKVLEQAFFDPQKSAEETDTLREAQASIERQTKIQAILESIRDPQWRQWCSQLDFTIGAPPYISVRDLEEIASARFLEVEDDRLVVIACPTYLCESRIEALRFQLIGIVRRTYPKIRNIRTRRVEEEEELPF